MSPSNTQDFGDGSWLWATAVPTELRYAIATLVGLMIMLGASTAVILTHHRPVASAATAASPTEEIQQAPVEPTEGPAAVSSGDTEQTTATDVQASIDTAGTAAPQTNLQVNGQQVPVPDNGSVTKTIESPDDTTSVNLNVQSQSIGTGTTNSSTNLQITTQSTSETSVENSE